MILTRRNMLAGLVVGAGGLVSGCDAVVRSTPGKEVLFRGEDFHRALQRSLMNRDALAREFDAADMSPRFRTNGNTDPGTPDYAAHVANRFADWRLVVDGMVARPSRFSLADLQAMPQRAQITRHDCVEGWSAIGKWQGPRLATILNSVGLSSNARYLVFHCADSSGGVPYYESIDLYDAFHPQTILAWAMNDARLTVGHGAPVRLRVERMLGYKHAKFVMRIEAVESFAAIGKGKGGFWEDRSGYEWYAGI